MAHVTTPKKMGQIQFEKHFENKELESSRKEDSTLSGVPKLDLEIYEL